MVRIFQLLFYICPILLFYIVWANNKIEAYCKSLEKKIDCLESIIKETDEHVDRLISYFVDKDNEK